MRIIYLAALFVLCGHWAQADTVSMSFGEKIPPFVFPETNSGIELEVIGEALAFRGHHLQPHYYAFARVPLAFKAHQVDASMTDLGEDLTPYGGYYGDPAVIYDNVLITLKERHLVIHRPEDLHGLSVIAFQGAAKRYPEWLTAARDEGMYFEQNNQALQVLTLDAGHYDVVLCDRNIYRYFALQAQKELHRPLRPVEFHPFVKLNPLNYRPVFRSEKIRDDFNAGLRHLKDTGRYQAIYDHYLKE